MEKNSPPPERVRGPVEWGMVRGRVSPIPTRGNMGKMEVAKEKSEIGMKSL